MLTPTAMYLYFNRNRLNRQRREQAMTLGGFIFLALALYAAYLSWTCNTKQGIQGGMRVVYSAGAFVDNFTYIVNYFLFQRNTALTCKF
jgi:hypothetical protein